MVANKVFLQYGISLILTVSIIDNTYQQNVVSDFSRQLTQAINKEDQANPGIISYISTKFMSKVIQNFLPALEKLVNGRFDKPIKVSDELKIDKTKLAQHFDKKHSFVDHKYHKDSTTLRLKNLRVVSDMNFYLNWWKFAFNGGFRVDGLVNHFTTIFEPFLFKGQEGSDNQRININTLKAHFHINPDLINFEITHSWLSVFQYFLNHNWFNSKTKLIDQIKKGLTNDDVLAQMSNIINGSLLNTGLTTVPINKFQSNIAIQPVQDPKVKDAGLLVYLSGFVYSQKTKNLNIGTCPPMRHVSNLEKHNNDVIIQVGECPILGMFNTMIENKWTNVIPLNKPGKFHGKFSMSFQKSKKMNVEFKPGNKILAHLRMKAVLDGNMAMLGHKIIPITFDMVAHIKMNNNTSKRRLAKIDNGQDKPLFKYDKNLQIGKLRLDITPVQITNMKFGEMDIITTMVINAFKGLLVQNIKQQSIPINIGIPRVCFNIDGGDCLNKFSVHTEQDSMLLTFDLDH